MTLRQQRNLFRSSARESRISGAAYHSLGPAGMRLDPKAVRHVLERVGVKHLYHANTVATAMTFLEVGGLLSRGEVRRRGHYQTPQASDRVDEKFDVIDDVFVDGIDIHSRGRTRNNYGPVLFVLSLALLEWDQLPPLWVTRKNPIGWREGQKDSLRYYRTVEEFAAAYKFGDYFQLLTLRGATDPIPVHFIDHIELDDPKRGVRKPDTSCFVGARAALGEASGKFSDLPVDSHRCPASCTCEASYADVTEEEMKRLFAPRGLSTPRVDGLRITTSTSTQAL